MKKFKILFATVMLGIATVGGFQAYEYANMSGAEALLLENVEALTQNEDGELVPGTCGVLFSDGTESCNMSRGDALYFMNHWNGIRWCCDSCGTTFC